jgi:hypothetical protein
MIKAMNPGKKKLLLRDSDPGQAMVEIHFSNARLSAETKNSF